MKLLYRGVQHSYHLPTLEVTEAQIQGNYRGVTYHRPIWRVPPVAQPSHDLMYRGVPYITSDRAGQIAVGQVEIAPPPMARPTHPVVLAPRQTNELVRVHEQHLRQNLERRLRSAQERGDQHLVYLLEAERRQLA
jgi:hypothetical protein